MLTRKCGTGVGKVALAQLLAGRARPHKRFTLPLTSWSRSLAWLVLPTFSAPKLFFSASRDSLVPPR